MHIAFQYDIGWVRQGFPISPFSLPLKEDVFIPPNSSREVFNGLFGVFADSLPDSWGELLLDRYLESLGIKREDISTLDRLAYVGSSGMGALEYIPSKEAELDITTAGLDFDKVAKECKKILSSKTSDQLDLLYKMAGSSGGTRPKILLSEEGKEYIIKFPAKKDPSISGKREYDYYITAGECGIVMSDSFLIPSAECEGLIGVVKPGAKAAAEATKNNKIGVIATRATVNSGIYEEFLHKTDPKIHVYKQACPLFVPLVEEGWIDDDVTRSIIHRYLDGLLKKNIDALILGCTHYHHNHHRQT